MIPSESNIILQGFNADVVKLADTPDLGSGDASRGGSSPFIRTKIIIKLCIKKEVENFKCKLIK